jgi:hypothetical protein
MDFTWSNDTGPIDQDSPFVAAFNRSQQLKQEQLQQHQSQSRRSNLHSKRMYWDLPIDP